MAPGTTLLPSLVGVGLLLSLSAFFSSSESAIFSLPDEWGPPVSAGRQSEGRTLRRLRANPHRLLVTLLVGNNLVNIAITSIVTLLVARFVPPGGTVLIATLGVSALILVFGEIVPKSYGLGHAETWSLRVARPISVVERLLTPLVVVFDFVTRWLTASLGGDIQLEKPYLDD
jgi:Mg2+/Co2+ transporter CorB